MEKFFETASFHLVKPCNMRCKFCYATFDDMRIVNQLSKEEVFNILDKLKDAGLQKVTFAGGEPLLYKWLYEVVLYSKSIGLTTSIITNGSLLKASLLYKFKNCLDWIGVSIDSLDNTTNTKIGRVSSHNIDYLELCLLIKELGFKLKINTVVNSFNWNEDINWFIDMIQPNRWKVLQALKVEGQNDLEFENIKVTTGQFNKYVDTHKFQKSIIIENNELMTGSYLLIDPQGRLFENSKGAHSYSRPLQNNKIEDCLMDINLNREMFIKRGGIYNW